MPGPQRPPGGAEEAGAERAAGARARGRATSASALETTEPGAAAAGSASSSVSSKASESQGSLSSGEREGTSWKLYRAEVGIRASVPRLSPKEWVSNLSPFLTLTLQPHSCSEHPGK